MSSSLDNPRVSRRRSSYRYEFPEHSKVVLEEIEKTGNKALESGKLMKHFYKQLQRVEFACLFVIIFTIVLIICVYPYEFDNNPMHKDAVEAVLYIVFILSIALVGLTVYRYHVVLKYDQAKGHKFNEESLFHLNTLIPMVIECTVLMIVPYPWTLGIEINTITLYGDDEIYYQVNEILQYFSCFRILVTLRVLTMTSYWDSDRAQRVCEMYGARPGTWFALRSVMRSTPARIVFTAYFLSIPFFGYMLMIAEGPTTRLNDDNNYTFTNSVWNVIVTMASVGYGDYYPRTLLGRTSVFFVCIWSVTVNSLMVVTLIRIFTMHPTEERAYGMLRRLVIKDEMRYSAAVAFTTLLKAKMITRKTGVPPRDKIQLYKKSMNNYRKSARQYRESANKILTNDEKDFALDFIVDKLQMLEKQNHALIEANRSIMAELKLDTRVLEIRPKPKVSSALVRPHKADSDKPKLENIPETLHFED